MRKILPLLVLLAATGCAQATAGQSRTAEAAALQQRADAYVRDGRYLEALTFYRDIAANPAWADRAGAGLYENMALIYRDYVGDAAEAARWQARAGAPETARAKKNPLSVEQPLPAAIRVLVSDAASCRISSHSPMTVRRGEAALQASDIAVSAMGDGVAVNAEAPAQGPVKICPAAGQVLRLDGRPCCGALSVGAARGRLQVICEVPLEAYLQGVLPREMAPSWPLEALKAQAVAARTYALYHCLLRRAEPYDVLATTSSQVYDGGGARYESVSRAVSETAGQVLAFQGRLALALFHANSGGRTEPFGDIWGGNIPYLTGAMDPESIGSSGAAWDAKLAAGEIAAALAGFGIDAEAVQDIAAVRRSASGRIERLKITAGRQTFFFSGNSFRLIVGPGKVKGTNFEVEKSGGSFLFRGAGYGHGAGMSQWGANGMAKKGASCTDILGRYYPGARLVRIAH